MPVNLVEPCHYRRAVLLAWSGLRPLTLSIFLAWAYPSLVCNGLLLFGYYLGRKALMPVLAFNLVVLPALLYLSDKWETRK